jgi:glycosyltransferase involved in cell wall biosynthesis
LDYHFTIPNFPSRVLNYLSSSKPILAATDPVCDMGDLAEENGFGVKCLSNDVDSFSSAVNRIVSSDRKKMGENAQKSSFRYDIERVGHEWRQLFDEQKANLIKAHVSICQVP